MTDWDDIAAQALALPDAELSSYYGKPAVMVGGRPIVTPAREDDSFVLHIDTDTKAILLETDPATFWQTPHYQGWPGVLVRYATHDPDRVAALIARSRDWAIERGPPKQRRKAK